MSKKIFQRWFHTDAVIDGRGVGAGVANIKDIGTCNPFQFSVINLVIK